MDNLRHRSGFPRREPTNHDVLKIHEMAETVHGHPGKTGRLGGRRGWRGAMAYVFSLPLSFWAAAALIYFVCVLLRATVYSDYSFEEQKRLENIPPPTREQLDHLLSGKGAAPVPRFKQ